MLCNTFTVAIPQLLKKFMRFLTNFTKHFLGIDPVIWEQAKRDNPDSTSLIPVPMIGFSQLRNRLRLQEEKSKIHQSRLDVRRQ